MRIHILGASGSGSTTLGEALAQELGCAYFDTDAYFWLPSNPPFSNRRPADERNLLLAQHLEQQEAWVLGGSLVGWGYPSLFDFDLIVFLWLPPTIRMQRLKAREYERYGDVIYTDPNRKLQYERFMAWAADYDEANGIANRNINSHEAWLASLSVPILELLGDLSVQQRLNNVLKAMDELRNCC